jgi:hypothetical protein
MVRIGAPSDGRRKGRRRSLKHDGAVFDLASPSSTTSRRWRRPLWSAALGAALAATATVATVSLVVTPAYAEAQSESKPKKKKAKAGAKKRGKRAAVASEEAEEPATAAAKPAKKFTTKSVIAMVKKGRSEDEIINRAAASDYVLTAKDEKALKKAKIPSSLIVALKGGEGNVEVVKKQGLSKPAKPEDIDFDDLPSGSAPAKGSSGATAAAAEAPSVPRTSARPKTTLLPTDEAQPTDAPPPRRKPLVASDS